MHTDELKRFQKASPLWATGTPRSQMALAERSYGGSGGGERPPGQAHILYTGMEEQFRLCAPTVSASGAPLWCCSESCIGRRRGGRAVSHKPDWWTLKREVHGSQYILPFLIFLSTIGKCKNKACRWDKWGGLWSAGPGPGDRGDLAFQLMPMRGPSPPNGGGARPAGSAKAVGGGGPCCRDRGSLWGWSVGSPLPQSSILLEPLC